MKKCPVCSFLLSRRNNFAYHNSKSYYSITCLHGSDHFMEYIYDDLDTLISFYFSLDFPYATFIKLDYINLISSILFYKNGDIINQINVDYLLIPDFPDLQILKEKINKYRTFS